MLGLSSPVEGAGTIAELARGFLQRKAFEPRFTY